VKEIAEIPFIPSVPIVLFRRILSQKLAFAPAPKICYTIA